MNARSRSLCIQNKVSLFKLPRTLSREKSIVYSYIYGQTRTQTILNAIIVWISHFGIPDLCILKERGALLCAHVFSIQEVCVFCIHIYSSPLYTVEYNSNASIKTSAPNSARKPLEFRQSLKSASVIQNRVRKTPQARIWYFPFFASLCLYILFGLYTYTVWWWWWWCDILLYESAQARFVKIKNIWFTSHNV